MANLLTNGDFTADWGEQSSHRAWVCKPGETPQIAQIGNIFSPPGWDTWFRHEPDVWDQPEVRDARSDDRLYEGHKAQLLFTFYRKHWGGFLQVVPVTPGKRYRLTAWAHAWSNSQNGPHVDDPRWSEGPGYNAGYISPPLSEGAPAPMGYPGTADDWRNFAFNCGLDPNGGVNPFDASVRWGTGASIYNVYAQVPAVEVTATGPLLTVWLRSRTLWAFKHNDAYWGAAILEEVEEEPDPPEPCQCVGLPRTQYERTYNVIPATATDEQAVAVFLDGWRRSRETAGGSYDDAGVGALDVRKARLYGIPSNRRAEFVAWYAEHYPGVSVEFAWFPGETEPNPIEPPDQGGELKLVYPTTYMPPTVTQPFGGAHGGIDLRSSWAQWQSEILAAYAGEVVTAGYSAVFGYQVLTRTTLPDGRRMDLRYAHMLEGLYVAVGDQVTAGQKLGRAGSTGTSTGDHLHFSVNLDGKYVDPAPLIDWPDAPTPPPPYAPPAGIDQDGGLVTLHLQTFPTVAETFISATHPRIVKGLIGQQDWWGVMRNDPKARFLWRHHGSQHESLSAATPALAAQTWIGYWIDSLRRECDRIEAAFPGLAWPYMLVESWNEIYACGDPRMPWFIEAECEFLRQLHDAEPRVAGVVFTAPVGNPLVSEYPLLVPLAKAAVECRGWFGYHGYWHGTKTQQGMVVGGQGPVYDDHWQHLAGRWTEIDKVLCAAGYPVRWFLGESGLVGNSAPDGAGYALNPGSGWRDSAHCIGGDWARYEAEILEMRRRIREWNAAHQNRCDGFALFTTGADYMGWQHFQVQGPEMAGIAAAL